MEAKFSIADLKEAVLTTNQIASFSLIFATMSGKLI